MPAIRIETLFPSALFFFNYTFPTPTVLPLNALFCGILLQGNHSHPASLPPGMWNILKPSPSPTLVTLPNKLLFPQNARCIDKASGMRRR